MEERKGARFAKTIRKNVQEMEGICGDVDEETATKRPADRWSPKEILSHLCGREGVGILPAVRAYVEQDTPRLDLHPEDPFFTEGRSRMTFAQLLAAFGNEYARLAEFVSALSDEQFARKAHIPAFKKAPFGEYPTLEDFLGVFGDRHLEFHINHMKEILQALGRTV